MTTDPIVAYFSMEVALEARFATYSGGLGTLAGDTIRAAAGYFRQHLDGLFDQCLAEWRIDNLYLRYAVSIPLDRIRDAHREATSALLAEVERKCRSSGCDWMSGSTLRYRQWKRRVLAA